MNKKPQNLTSFFSRFFGDSRHLLPLYLCILYKTSHWNAEINWNTSNFSGNTPKLQYKQNKIHPNFNLILSLCKKGLVHVSKFAAGHLIMVKLCWVFCDKKKCFVEIFFHDFVEIIFYKILFLGNFRHFSNSYFMLNNRRPVSAVFLWTAVH